VIEPRMPISTGRARLALNLCYITRKTSGKKGV
jgi:hypothetical protein